MEATDAPVAPVNPKLAAKQELAARILARRRLLAFVQRMYPQYKAGWVHEDICRRLERFSDEVAAGTSPRLMLLMPPRHGKSELASKNFPAWHLGRYPDHEIIACSYNISLAMGFSKKIKQMMDEPSYQTVFPETKLHPDNRSTEEWSIYGRRGGYVAAGVGGGITGKGAHVLIIDDPIKNAEEADSDITRESIWDWYGSTAYTRLAPGAGVLIIQTWWHDDDLAGRVQQAMAAASPEDDDVDRFEIIKYPAIAEEAEFLNIETDDILRIPVETQTEEECLEQAAKFGYDTSNLRFLRPKGAALHPDRYDTRKLRRIKNTIAPRFWSALYQQNPVPDDGAFFTKDMFRRGSLPRLRDCYVQIAWDFAIGEKQHNDYTVGSVSLLDYDGMMHIADMVAFKKGDADFIVKSILDLAQKWYHPSQVLGFEDGQIFRAIESTLKKEMRRRNFFPRYEKLKPLTDKKARASALQGRMQQGMVSFCDQAQWYDATRQEMLRFPAGVHDDRVDSLAWNAQLVVEREAPRRPEAPKVKSWKDKLGSSGRTGGGHMAA